VTQVYFIEEYEACLAANDKETANRHAHTLKGIAATLGMTQLSVSSERLENAIEEDKTDLSSILKAVENDLNTVLNELKIWDKMCSTDLAQTPQPPLVMTQEEIQKNIEKLNTYIESNTVQALPLAQAILPNITDRRLYDSMLKIVAALNLYDFEQAMKHLTILKEYLEDSEQ
jgi:HPt (histidine-containing phosphotransfer) domain-containing protein